MILKKTIDSSLTPVNHIWVTLSDLFKHFTIIRTQRMGFRKMPEVRIKPDKMLKYWLFLKIYINDFLRNSASK